MNAKGHSCKRAYRWAAPQERHGGQLSRLPRLHILNEQDRWKEFINSLKITAP
ncbi:unnamed protein product [Musa hybrid cultivar]